VSAWTRGVVASACLALLAGCSDSDDGGSDPAELSPADRSACEAFVDDLPETLDGEEATGTEPLGRTYGDPEIRVVCGVESPEGFTSASQCEVANGVGWYAPAEQYDDQSADVTIYAVTYHPVVELRLPAAYRPNGLAAALAELAGPVKRHLSKRHDCI